MDASQCELLVHITACSTAKDDKRYTSIAQSVLHFCPATRTKVTGPELDSLAEIRTAPQDTPRKALPSQTSDRPQPNGAPERCSTDLHEHLGLRPAPTRGGQRSCSTWSSFSDSFAASLGCPPRGKPRHSGRSRPEAWKRSNGSLSDSCPGMVDRDLRRKRRRLGGERANDYDSPSHHRQEACVTDLQRQELPRTRTFPLESLVRRSIDSPSSTLSPSQPLQHDSLVPQPQPHESFRSPSCTIVDLTTPEHPRQGLTQFQSQRPSRGHGPRSMQAPRIESESSRQAHQAVAVIGQLADDVRGPNPKGGRSRFTTHLTKTLERVAIRVPLSKYFRPAHVARDVGVLERGYWQFSVRIGDSLGRHSDSPQWTEQDFAKFWQGLARFIQQGKAGWGTRLMKESRDGNEWRIRLFTWAELLGHIWVILWILSNKKTQESSMQWIAGDGMMVVQMSGAQRLRRRSRVWRRTGPEGEGGVWGMQRLSMQDRVEDR